MIDSIFQVVKRIPTIELAKHYLPTVKFRRSGSRWFACCPFHDDHHPSMVLFSDGGWKCFGCQLRGDGVDLVARVLNLRPIEAARLIANDFGLPVDDRPLSREARRRAEEAARDRELERAFRQWCERTYLDLCVIYRVIGRIKAGGDWEKYADLAHLELYIEHLLDVLQYGSESERVEIFLQLGRCVANGH